MAASILLTGIATGALIVLWILKPKKSKQKINLKNISCRKHLK